MQYDFKRVVFLLNGLNVAGTSGTDFVYKHNKSEDNINIKKGKTGDAVSEMVYTGVDTIQFTQTATSSYNAQLRKWFNSREMLSVTISDPQKGYNASGTAYISSTGDLSDSDDNTYTLLFEDYEEA